MANRFICSCGDHVDTATAGLKWDVFNDTIIWAGGYNGTNGLRAGVSAYTRPRCVKAVTVTGTTVIFGFRWWTEETFPLAGGTTYVLAAVHRRGTNAFSNSTKQVSVNIHADGRIYFRRGNWNGTDLGSTTGPVLTSNTWHYIEIRVTVATAGVIELVVDDIPRLTLTGVNTVAIAGTPVIDGVEIIPWTIDDVYVNDTSGSRHTYFMGKGFHVLVRRMTADHAVQWTPGAGTTNYPNIDDTAPDANVTHNRTGFAGLTDVYTAEPLPPEVTAVHVVQGNFIGHRASSLVVPTVAQVAEIEATRYVDDATAQGLASGQKDYLHTWQEAPDGSGAWTPDKVDATKWGYKRVS